MNIIFNNPILKKLEERSLVSKSVRGKQTGRSHDVIHVWVKQQRNTQKFVLQQNI